MKNVSARSDRVTHGNARQWNERQCEGRNERQCEGRKQATVKFIFVETVVNNLLTISLIHLGYIHTFPMVLAPTRMIQQT